MVLEIFLFAAVGCGLGIATGLVPGLHINNLLPVMVTLLAVIGDPYYLAAMIVSMAVTQTFVGFVPSIFLGAPEADTSLSTLPGHKLLQEGRGFEAIKLTVIGGIGSLAVSMLLLAVLSPYFPDFYDASRPYIQYVLVGMVAFMVVGEKKPSRMLYALAVVALSGALGFLALQSSIVSQQNVLFPTLAGLFGISIMATSILQKSSIPEQSGTDEIGVGKMDIVKSVALGAVAGMIVGFLPAVGVSQVAAMFQYVGGLGEARTFLVSLSGINLANEVFSLNSVYLIDNPRSGASVALERILGSLEMEDVMLFISVIIFSAGVGAVASLVLGKKIPPLLAKMNYTWLSLGIISMMTAMVFMMTGVNGLMIAATATSIGILCNYLGVKKSNCMGVLLVPSIMFFSGIVPWAVTVTGI